MAETTKKAKAPAAPRKKATKTKEAVQEPQAATSPVAADSRPAAASHPAENHNSRAVSHDEIARLAHRYWAERGHRHGNPEEDWYRAEQELRKRAS